MIYDFLSHYFDKYFWAELIEHAALDQYEFAYYLFRYKQEGEVHFLAIVEGHDLHDAPESVTETQARLEEQAGLEVKGWKVLQKHQTRIGSDWLSAKQVEGDLSPILALPLQDGAPSCMIADVTIGNRQAH